EVGVRPDEWVEKGGAGSTQSAQVAGRFRRGGDPGRQGAAVLLPLALIVPENEGFFLLNRRPERAAELIPESWGNEAVSAARDGPGLRERIAGGPRAAAPEPKRAAMKQVGARLGL